MGAQWLVVWNEVHRSITRAGLGEPSELIVDSEQRLVLIRRVTERYFVVLSLRRGTHLATALRELDRTMATLRAEM